MIQIQADFDNEEERDDRICQQCKLDDPYHDAFSGDPREWEKKKADKRVIAAWWGIAGAGSLTEVAF